MDDHWKEEFRRAAEEADEVKHSDVWKKVRGILGVVLAVLMISYILVDPTIRQVIVGFFESSQAEEGEFNYMGKTISFEQDTFEELQWWFNSNQENEIKLCLEGRVDGNDYVVERISAPEIHFQSVYKVISEPCPRGTIIDLHTHPYQKCVASQTDLGHLDNMKKLNEDVLLGVMCTEDRISFYG